jgi:transcriptional regulator with GAF, ATPase, and Fis domain
LNVELGEVVPEGVKGDVLAAALVASNGPAGVLLLVAKSGTYFDAPHAELAESLREPFAVALENDRRLHEMATLREAAEADRRSLLSRLGRTERADPIVGADGGLRPVLERVDLVARSDVPVLILGETGTGKEVIARAIHNRSPRSAAPFIRVNCGAIPPELIDSQLFGHERGSFTGAVETRQGWFERADGGTLFLDEIGELPPAAQVRLLRVLQDGYIERVGGQQPIHVDVRIVAATHRDLQAMVKTSQFREDLWYRVAVFPVPLPPLRERPEDIPGLARHFAERAATRFGLPVVMPTPDDVRLLVAYPWPGNIRELGAVIDRAALLGEGKQLQIARALGVQAAPTAPPALAASTVTANPPIAPLDDAVRRHIESALAATRGRIEGPFGAAAILRINPHTLRARMRKLHINWRRFRAVLD